MMINMNSTNWDFAFYNIFGIHDSWLYMWNIINYVTVYKKLFAIF